MVQKVNILSQHLFITLLPEHKNSLFFFKSFFCYKVLLDSILLFFLEKSNFNLLKFYLGFSKNFFFLNLYVFKNFSLKSNSNLFFKKVNPIQFSYRTLFFNKSIKKSFLVSNQIPFTSKFNLSPQFFLFLKFNF